jgi:fumarate reductase subunit C
MSPGPETPAYTEYHPRWYRTRVSTYWWLGSWRYLKFILREISSIFVALAVGMTLLQVNAFRRGPEAYSRFEALMKTPLTLAVSLLCFLFVLFHAITWFNLTPKAMAVRIKGKRLPDLMIALPNFVIWAVISCVVAWFVLRT